MSNLQFDVRPSPEQWLIRPDDWFADRKPAAPPPTLHSSLEFIRLVRDEASKPVIVRKSDDKPVIHFQMSSEAKIAMALSGLAAVLSASVLGPVGVLLAAGIVSVAAVTLAVRDSRLV